MASVHNYIPLETKTQTEDAVLIITCALVTGDIDNSSIFACIVHPPKTLSAQQQRCGPMLVLVFASSAYYSGGGDRDQYDNMPTIDEINQQKREASYHETTTSQLISKSSQQIQELVRSHDDISLIDELSMDQHYPNNNFTPFQFQFNIMFLQMVLPDTTVTYIVRSRARDELQNNRPSRPGKAGFLLVLLTAIRETLHDVDFVSCTFGFLAVVALDPKGDASLTYLDAETLAMDAIREHPDSPQLHEVAFTLLKNMDVEAVVDFPSDSYEEFVKSLFN